MNEKVAIITRPQTLVEAQERPLRFTPNKFQFEVQGISCYRNCWAALVRKSASIWQRKIVRALFAKTRYKKSQRKRVMPLKRVETHCQCIVNLPVTKWQVSEWHLYKIATGVNLIFLKVPSQRRDNPSLSKQNCVLMRGVLTLHLEDITLTNNWELRCVPSICSLVVSIIGSCQSTDKACKSLQVTQLTHQQVPALYLYWNWYPVSRGQFFPLSFLVFILWYQQVCEISVNCTAVGGYIIE